MYEESVDSSPAESGVSSHWIGVARCAGLNQARLACLAPKYFPFILISKKEVFRYGESNARWNDYEISSLGRDILAVVHYTSAERVHLVGALKSAASIFWAAAEELDRISSIVLIAPFVRNLPAKAFMKVMMWLLMKNPWSVSSWLSYYKTLSPTSTPDDFEEYLTDLRANLRERVRMDAAHRYGAPQS